jgi:hypothetical protein
MQSNIIKLVSLLTEQSQEPMNRLNERFNNKLSFVPIFNSGCLSDKWESKIFVGALYGGASFAYILDKELWIDSPFNREITKDIDINFFELKDECKKLSAETGITFEASSKESQEILQRLRVIKLLLFGPFFLIKNLNRSSVAQFGMLVETKTLLLSFVKSMTQTRSA